MSDLKALLDAEYESEELYIQETYELHQRIWDRDREELRRMIDAYSDRPNILLSALDAFVSAARREGFSNAALEREPYA
tara:strand:+ start:188 stop:424 length:237 start_codon:yes stop_codon:yes gene_type:complete